MTRIPPVGLRILLAAILLLTGELLAGAATPVNAAQPSSGSCLSANEALLLDRINTFRQINGLAPLIASPTLTAAARHHAESMATFNYFPADYSVRHEGENQDQTITWQENIANFGYPDNTHTARSAIIGAGTDSVSTIYRSLTDLPVYREVLTDRRYHAIGIGFGSNSASEEGSYWAITFGSISDGALAPCDGVAIPVPIVASGRTDNSSDSTVAYDGDYSTYWATTTKKAPPSAWIWFDLGSPQAISEIDWMFAKAGAADTFAIDVSLDRETWSQVTMKSNGAVDEWRSVAWQGTARYIRFYFANPNKDRVLGYLSEVRVLR
jgi:uncharacterized protein YkwD